MHVEATCRRSALYELAGLFTRWPLARGVFLGRYVEIFCHPSPAIFSRRESVLSSLLFHIHNSIMVLLTHAVAVRDWYRWFCGFFPFLTDHYRRRGSWFGEMVFCYTAIKKLTAVSVVIGFSFLRIATLKPEARWR
jgi:hypothetical protein